MECVLCGKGSKVSTFDYEVRDVIEGQEEQRLEILEELRAVDRVETREEKEKRLKVFETMMKNMPVLEKEEVKDETDWDD